MSPDIITGLYILSALPMSFVLTMALRRLANVLGLQKADTAYVGGISIFLAFGSILAFTLPIYIALSLSFFSASLFLLLTGIVADRKSVSKVVLFTLSLAAAVIVVRDGGFLLPVISTTVAFGVTALAASIVIFTWSTLSKFSGAVEGISLIAMLWMVLMALSTELVFGSVLAHTVLILVLAGYLLLSGLVKINKGTVVSCGLGGALFLGLSIVWFAMYGLSGREVLPSAMVWVIALPVFDFVASKLRGLSHGKSASLCDLLMDSGYTEARAVKVFLRLAFIFGGIAMVAVAWHVPDVLSYAGLFLAFVLYTLGGNRLIKS